MPLTAALRVGIEGHARDPAILELAGLLEQAITEVGAEAGGEDAGLVGLAEAIVVTDVVRVRRTVLVAEVARVILEKWAEEGLAEVGVPVQPLRIIQAVSVEQRSFLDRNRAAGRRVADPEITEIDRCASPHTLS